MNNSAVGEFKGTQCALCGKALTVADALVSGGGIVDKVALYNGGIQVLDFGAHAHIRCYTARYREYAPAPSIEHQGQLDLFDTQGVSEGSVACPVASLEAPPAGADNVREYLWYRNDTKAPIAEKVAAAVERYAYKFGHVANVVYVSEADWRQSGVQPGDEVVPGVRLFVSGYVHEFECKVGRE